MAFIDFEKAGTESVLGLQLVSLAGHEEISELFRYDLVLKSEDSELIAPTELIGRDISIRVDYFEDFGKASDNDTRYIHGIVNCFTILNVDGFNAGSGRSGEASTRYYAVELVPLLWFLTKKSHFRIYQDLSSDKIVDKILKEYDITSSFPAGVVTRENCVQYLETDYDFLIRLLDNEGFIFYFKHSKDDHELVITNSSQYLEAGELTLGYEVSKWSPSFNFISSKWVCSDNSYEEKFDNKDSSTKSKIKDLNNDSYSRILTTNNIGCDAEDSVLTAQAELLAGREDARYEVISLSSNSKNICAGTNFTLDGIDEYSEFSGSDLVVIKATHEMNAGNVYSNELTCIPGKSRYWGKGEVEAPKVRGPMTATVIENTDPKELGRVKVAFFGEVGDNEATSGWVRVTQIFGGSVRGAMFTPEIDDEVLIGFLNGNPDRPLITGSIYNGTNIPQRGNDGEYFTSLRNGIITPAGELYFHDEDSKEMFHIRANKDCEKNVIENDTLTIGGKLETKITGDEEKEVLEGNKTTKVTKGEVALESTKKNIKMKTGKNTEIDADKLIVFKAKDDVTLTSGKDVKMKSDKNFDLKVGTNFTADAGSEIKMSVGGSTLTMSASGIELVVGSNNIEISASGITMKGAMVSIQGSITADLKAPMTTVSADGMLTVKGGVVMIN